MELDKEIILERILYPVSERARQTGEPTRTM